MSDQKPAGWASTELGEVLLAIIGGGTPSRDVARYFEGDIPWFTVKDLQVLRPTDAEEHISEEAVRNSATNVIPPGTLIVATRITPGKAIRPTVSCAINQDLKALILPEGIHSDFLLFYFLLHRAGIHELGSGTTVKGIKLETLRALPLLLPPSAEQARIVSRIEELFSDLDTGEESLRQAQAQLKRYRQSVLKAAVTGELTRAWREQNADKLESGEALLKRILKAQGASGQKAAEQKLTPGKDTLGELPASWVKARIDAVGDVQLGRQRAPQHHTGEHMRPYLRVANVYEERIDTSDVMEMNFTTEEYRTYVLKRNDILLNEGQSAELVGRPAIFKDELPGACFTNTLVRFRGHDGVVLPGYALTVFLYFLHSGIFKGIAKVTTNIAHLGAGRFAELAMPLPCIEEQHEIIQQVDRIRSGIDAMAKEIGARLRSASALRQSILKAAFSGKLVPQDPNDEPASELLQCIAAERAAQGARPARNAAPRAPRKARAAAQPSAPAPAAPSVAVSGLAAARKVAGLSQAQLAAAIGINQAYVSQMETGKRAMTADQAAAIAKALGVEPSVLTQE